MTSNELRAFAHDIDPQLSLAWYGSHYVEIRRYSEIPGQQRTWRQLALIRNPNDLLPWLRGYWCARRLEEKRRRGRST